MSIMNTNEDPPLDTRLPLSIDEQIDRLVKLGMDVPDRLFELLHRGIPESDGLPGGMVQPGDLGAYSVLTRSRATTVSLSSAASISRTPRGREYLPF